MTDKTMPKIQIIAALFLACILTSCVVAHGYLNSSEINSLSVGMTKQEVLSLLGRPQTTEANTEREILQWSYITPGLIRRFVVTFQNQSVTSFELR